MQRTSTRALVLVVLALISCVVATSVSWAARPTAVPKVQTFTPARLPAGVNQPVVVVVQLSGDPVAVQQGNAGRKLSQSEKNQIKAQLKGQQDGLRPSIEAAGGKVLGNYQAAYNGIKVQIASNKVNQLATLPGVIGVGPIHLFTRSNVHSVPLIGAPGVWNNGLHGENVKIAIIDTGIDYTHANFGGPGTVAAYAAAHAHETQPADPNLFGPGAARVKGGTDLVGDSYQPDDTMPNFQPTPHPDPNPLDCNGHGSHVAGTAAGSGVLSTGATYNGLYNASTVSSNTWNIGPGVAPRANLYAVRVFGCEGPTNEVLDAIEWAVDNDMDVINMSLGSPFGNGTDPEAVAVNNAAKAGVIVVTSAGNENATPYTVGLPSTADAAISVAANDANADYPGANITLTAPNASLTAQDSNGFALPAGPLTVKVIMDGSAISLGCSVAAFGSLAPNTIAVVKRGVCARVAKAIFGQQAGAAAVLMINTSNSFPPFEGVITSNPDDGVPFNVTIPFFGAKSSDGSKLVTGQSATFAATNIPNPSFLGFASFTSGGPRSGDSFLKPELTAPGVSVISTLSGSGNQGTIISGTSMASPHVAGVATLTRQAHPSWSVADIKAALVNTGDPGLVSDYHTSTGGTGLVQPQKSTATRVVAHTDGGDFVDALNFGFAEMSNDFSKKRTITLYNNGPTAATFNVSEAIPDGSPHSVVINPTTVTVPPNNNIQVKVTLNVPVATVGDENADTLSFREVSGLIVFTPATGSDNAGVTLRVPYYFVPRALSGVETKIGKLSGNNPSTTATVSNSKGAIAGFGDFYAWGLSSKKLSGNQPFDIAAVGVQAFPGGGDSLMVFGINNYTRWSNVAQMEFDIFVDVDGDGVDDYVIVAADQGNTLLGDFNGIMAAFVFSLRTSYADFGFLANAPTDGSTIEIPAFASQLCSGLAHDPCLSPANPRITYHVQAQDLIYGGGKVVAGSAKFNAFSPSVSTGAFVGPLAPGQSDSSTVIQVNSAEFALTPALGIMVITLDNPAGTSEAQTIDLQLKKQ